MANQVTRFTKSGSCYADQVLVLYANQKTYIKNRVFDIKLSVNLLWKIN